MRGKRETFSHDEDESLSFNIHTPLPPHADATLYPADHPYTRRAQAILDRLQVSATALIAEQYGSDSPQLRRHLEHFAGHAVKVRVYRCEGTSVLGSTGTAGSIILLDRCQPGAAAATLAHELGHLICQHVTEHNTNNDAHMTSQRTTGGLAAVLRMALVDAWRCSPTLIGTYLHLGLNFLCVKLAPPSWSAPWTQIALEGSAGPAGGPTRTATAQPAPLLQPGQLGFSDVISRSRDIQYELEAEQLAR